METDRIKRARHQLLRAIFYLAMWIFALLCLGFLVAAVNAVDSGWYRPVLYLLLGLLFFVLAVLALEKELDHRYALTGSYLNKKQADKLRKELSENF